MDKTEQVQVTAGWVMRLALIVPISFIYVNAIAQAIADRSWLLLTGEIILWPLALLLYPFLAPSGHFAWPFADGTSFIPAFIVMMVCFLGQAYLPDE